MGTESGLFGGRRLETLTDDDWSWSPITYATGRTHAVLEMMTIHRVTDDIGTREYLDKNLYVGAASGFYVGGAKVSAMQPKGFLWLKTDAALNDLAWWTDDGVFVSHTAVRREVITSDSSETYWELPLQYAPVPVPSAACALATTAPIANLATGAPSVLDGAAVTGGMRILVKDQASEAENGVYVVQSAGTGANGHWNRATDLDSSGEFSAAKAITVSGGVLNRDSCWSVSAGATPFTLGATAVEVTNLWRRIAPVASGVYEQLLPHPTSRRLIAVHTNGLYEITENYDADADVWGDATTRAVLWPSAIQGAPAAAVFLTTNNQGEPTLLVGGTRGQWISATYSLHSAARWTRPVSVFGALASPAIFEEVGGAQVTGFTSSADTQHLTFSAPKLPWTNYLWERDFTDYYVAPWNSVGADIVVYVNGSPSHIPYILDADAGRIHFLQSLADNFTVQITIIREGAFITNVGVIPHEERIAAFVVGAAALTTLASDFADQSGTLTVAEPDKIPLTATLLELRTIAQRERVSVTVDPLTKAVTLTTPRSGTTLFPADFTEVFLVTQERLYGIEDRISQLATGSQGHTYHLSSVTGANKLQTAVRLRNQIPQFLTRFTGTSSASADRGLKKRASARFLRRRRLRCVRVVVRLFLRCGSVALGRFGTARNDLRRLSCFSAHKRIGASGRYRQGCLGLCGRKMDAGERTGRRGACLFPASCGRRSDRGNRERIVPRGGGRIGMGRRCNLSTIGLRPSGRAVGRWIVSRLRQERRPLFCATGDRGSAVSFRSFRSARRRSGLRPVLRADHSRQR